MNRTAQLAFALIPVLLLLLGGCDAPQHAAPRQLCARAAGVAIPQVSGDYFRQDPNKLALSGAAPQAPRLLSGDGAPTSLSSVLLDPTRPIQQVAPFRLPSEEHPDGTLLVSARSASAHVVLREVDTASMRILREVETPREQCGSSDSRPRIISTPSRVVLLGCTQGKHYIHFLDAGLRRVATQHPWSQSPIIGVADEATLVTFHAHEMGGGKLMSWDMQTGAKLAERSAHLVRFWGPAAGGWGVGGNTVFALSNWGASVGSMPTRFDRPMGAVPVTPGASASERLSPASDPQSPLIITPQGPVALLNGRATAFSAGLRPIATTAYDPEKESTTAAIDPTSGRVLFASGRGARRIGAPLAEWVLFDRQAWREPKATSNQIARRDGWRAFFHAGRGILFTRFPAPRVTILRWDKQS